MSYSIVNEKVPNRIFAKGLWGFCNNVVTKEFILKIHGVCIRKVVEKLMRVPCYSLKIQKRRGVGQTYLPKDSKQLYTQD